MFYDGNLPKFAMVGVVGGLAPDQALVIDRVTSATPASALETGQFALASSPNSAICSAVASASTVEAKLILVIVGPPSPTAIDTLAVVEIASGGVPALVSSNARNCEKHPACAAPNSSSGFVPSPSAKRDALENAPVRPVPVVIVPDPSSIEPFQVAVALAAMSSFLL